MKLIVPQKIIRKLKIELRAAGRREMGGVLMGEHLGNETFRIAAISFQRNGGSAVHFDRDPEQHRAFIDEFFNRTGHDYQRFNYMGEWHSHPSFPAVPSGPDFATMDGVLRDPGLDVSFALLIIVRLRIWNQMDMSATVFRVDGRPEPASVEIEAENEHQESESIFRRFLRFVRM